MQKNLPKLHVLSTEQIILFFKGGLQKTAQKSVLKNQQEQLQCYFIKSSYRYSFVSNQTLSIGKSLVPYDEITSNTVSQRVTSKGTGEQLPTNAKI